MVDSKKVRYLYLLFDPKNIGFMPLRPFLTAAFAQKVQEPVVQENKVFVGSNEIMRFVRNHLTKTYYSVH